MGRDEVLLHNDHENRLVIEPGDKVPACLLFDPSADGENVVHFSPRGSDSLRDKAEYPEVADALFETLAALADLQERLAGGAKRPGVEPEQVIQSVWNAYDIEEANDVLEQTGYERDGSESPYDFAVDELVPTGDAGDPDA